MATPKQRSAEDVNMINIHTHIFTLWHLPIITIFIVSILSLFQKIIDFLPLNIKFLDRSSRLISIGRRSKQRGIAHALQAHYPKSTQYVLLPLDFTYMGQGRHLPGRNYIDQLEELNNLYQANKKTFHPFICVDPNRPNVLALVKEYIEEHDFKGIKLYPPFGYFPFPFPYTDPNTGELKGSEHLPMSNEGQLAEVFAYAEEKQIPILSHCTPDGWQGNKLQYTHHPITGNAIKLDYHAQTYQFCHPKNYEYLLDQFPNLKLCLAHFGGLADWERHLNEPLEKRGSSTISDEGADKIELAGAKGSFVYPVWNPTKRKVQENTWVDTITDLLDNPKYPNVYADISFNAFTQESLSYLSLLLENPDLARKILFGTDFYVVRLRRSEKEFSVGLRGHLRDDALFRQISEINPKAFLG
jgi:predicted TIM-barrel fold metal-dependent hydrolase